MRLNDTQVGGGRAKGAVTAVNTNSNNRWTVQYPRGLEKMAEKEPSFLPPPWDVSPVIPDFVIDACRLWHEFTNLKPPQETKICKSRPLLWEMGED